MKLPVNTFLSCAVPATVLLVAGACGAQGDSAQLAESTQSQQQPLGLVPVAGDLGLLSTIASGAAGQVQLDDLAVKRTNSPLVREYAQYMEAYFNNTLNQAQNIGAQKSATVMAQVSIRDQFHYGRLEGRYGTFFDQKYLSYQNADAERAMAGVQEGYESTLDIDVRAFAQQLLTDLPYILALVQSVDIYRGTVHDQPGQFANFLAQTRLGSNVDKGKASGGVPDQGPGQGPSRGPGQTPGKGTGQTPGQAPGEGADQWPAQDPRPVPTPVNQSQQQGPGVSPLPTPEQK